MILRAANGRSTARLLGLMLLFAVFSMPFHSHAHIAAAQVKTECSCIMHGCRPELGLPPTVFSLGAVLAESSLPTSGSSLVSRDVPGLELIRGPPRS
jgi:hypothetical protein